MSSATSSPAHHNEPATGLVANALTKGKSAVGVWTRFWFEPSDPLTLCVIRILTAGMLFYNLCIWTLDFDAFFSANGLQPLETVQRLYAGSPVFSFWFYVPEAWLLTAHFCCLAIVFLFMTGTATRATSILSYLIAISYSQRVPIANFGLDQILGLLCLYLAIGPSGACLSVDRWIRERFAGKGHRLNQAAGTQEVLKLSSATVALRLIQIHLCVIYFWAGFAKLKGDTWFTGEAMWNVIANLEYQTTDLTWLAYVPWMPYLVAHVTVLWELFFCALVWNRTLRPVMLLIGTGMHFGIGAFLGMWTFGLAMTFCYFAFSDPDVWRRNWHRLFGKARTEASTEEATSSSVLTTSTAVASASHPFSVGISRNPPAEQKSVATPPAPVKLTGAGHPKRSLPGTELLIVALRENHRNSLRAYYRNHDVPCRSAATPEAALNLATAIQPASVLVMASELTSEQLIVLLEDLRDLTDAPILCVVSEHLMNDVRDRRTRVAFVQAPLTLREIHDALIETMWSRREPHVEGQVPASDDVFPD